MDADRIIFFFNFNFFFFFPGCCKDASSQKHEARRGKGRGGS